MAEIFECSSKPGRKPSASIQWRHLRWKCGEIRSDKALHGADRSGYSVPVLRQPEALAPRLDRDLRVPCGLFTTVHLVQLISCEVEQLLILFGSKNSFHFENV